MVTFYLQVIIKRYFYTDTLGSLILKLKTNVNVSSKISQILYVCTYNSECFFFFFQVAKLWRTQVRC